jgi:hypothetical protein
MNPRFEEWVTQAFQSRLVIADRVLDLIEVLKYPGEQKCPGGMY